MCGGIGSWVCQLADVWACRCVGALAHHRLGASPFCSLSSWCIIILVRRSLGARWHIGASVCGVLVS
jgi:hypothetical protein